MMLLLFGAMYASAAQGQTVYKCVAKGKPTSFQSEPCAAGSRTVRAVNAPPEAYSPPAKTWSPLQAQQQTVVYNYVTGQSDDRAQRRANCASAKNQRESTLQQVGLSRDHDLLRQLDTIVNNACKGL